MSWDNAEKCEEKLKMGMITEGKRDALQRPHSLKTYRSWDD